jgi:hypothetical protein
MQHRSRLVLISSAAPAAQPSADADRHGHTVLGERPCTALPDDDLDYFLRRPQVKGAARSTARGLPFRGAHDGRLFRAIAS